MFGRIFFAVLENNCKFACEDMGKPIGMADYQLIVPKKKLQKVLADETKAFSEGKENKEIL